MCIRDRGRLWLNGLLPCGAREREPAPLPPRPPRNPKAPPLLELTDVWFRYEKAGADILRDLNMRVEKGEWFCLVGGNGVGKSTAMKVAAGLLKPYRGRIKLLGREMKKPGDREQADCRLGLLPQNPQAPVSYTHLDVYKRQSSMWSTIKPAILLSK